MPSYSPYSSNQTRTGIAIHLHVYDLSPANSLVLNTIGLGIHHSGVEIDGYEYTFAGGAGVFRDTPKNAHQETCVFSHSVFIGTFDGNSTDIQRVISQLSEEFGPTKYNILMKNCNHFADAFIHKLVNTRLPLYVNRCADLGSYFTCLIPKNVLEGNGPVDGGDSSNGGGSGASGGSVYNINRQSSATIAFSGSGTTLGGNNNSSSTTNNGLDRRETARMAAMKRMNNQ